MAVGGAGTVHLSADDGVNWSLRRVPSSARLYSVSCASRRLCVAVGDRGTVVVSTDGGASWTARPSSTTEPLLSVACATGGPCVAAGEGGTLVRSGDGGRSWRTVASTSAVTLSGVTCPTARLCLATTMVPPTVDRSVDGGRTWRKVKTPVYPLVEMMGISCATVDWCVAVGTNAAAITSDDAGAHWVIAHLPADGELHGVGCAPAGACVVVGSTGQVVVEPGPARQWSPRSSGTAEMLLAGSCMPATCLGVGGGGTVVRSADGDAGPWHRVTGAPSTPHPARVLFVGDSVSYTLAEGLSHQAAAYGLSLINDGLFGCGILRGGPILVEGKPSTVTGPCNVGPGGWPSLYRTEVAQNDPQVSVLLLGRWDLMDRRYEGRWIWPGSPGFRADFLTQLGQAIDLLSAGGAQVVLLTTPVVGSSTTPSPRARRDVCSAQGHRLWCEDLPGRAAVLNRLLRLGATRSDGRAVVIDLAARVNPGTTYTRRVDGVTVRLADGVHFGVPGTDWLAPWLLPRLKALTADAR